MASPRKRRTPQRLNPTAKIPRVSMSLSDAGDRLFLPLTERVNSHWDTLLSERTPSLQGPRKRKGGKKKLPSPVVCNDPFPYAEFSSATLASLPTAAIPCDESCVCAIPILHQHMYYHTHNVVEKILQSRRSTLMEVKNGCDLSEGGGWCVYVGDIVMELDGPVDIGLVLREGKSSTRLSLVLEEGMEAQRWLLKLEVGETVKYLELKLDPRFAGIKCQHVGRMLQTTSSLMKLFLAENAESCVLLDSLRLEVWALKMMHHCGSASESGPKLAYQPLYSLFVETLYPIEMSSIGGDPNEGGSV